MEPWQSWTAAIVLGGAAVAYYSQTGKSNKRSSSKQVPGENSRSTASRRKQDKGVKSSPQDVLEDQSNQSSKASKKRKPRVEPTQDRHTELVSNDSTVTGTDQDAADQDWVRELEAAKKGVNLSASKTSGNHQRNKKAQGQNSLPQDAKSVDSEKALPSEAVSAHTTNAPATGDVSNMLEAPVPGASVLRLTGEEKPKKAKPQQAPIETESKKQRQNRKKAEEKKALLQEQERERQQLLEKQRRTAREARGEPAKNGLGAIAAPSMNAWSKPVQHTDSGEQPNGQVTQPLLDTFEQESSSTGSGKLQSNASTTSASSIADYGLPSEETQMEMLDQMNGWNEVPKTKRKHRKATAPGSPPTEPGVKESNNMSSYDAMSTSDLLGGTLKASAKSASNKAGSNGFAALEAATKYNPGGKSHPDDSDWPVE